MFYIWGLIHSHIHERKTESYAGNIRTVEFSNFQLDIIYDQIMYTFHCHSQLSYTGFLEVEEYHIQLSISVALVPIHLLFVLLFSALSLNMLFIRFSCAS